MFLRRSIDLLSRKSLTSINRRQTAATAGFCPEFSAGCIAQGLERGYVWRLGP